MASAGDMLEDRRMAFSQAFSTFTPSPACSSAVLTPSWHRHNVLFQAQLLSLSSLAPCFLGGQAMDAIKTIGGTVDNIVGLRKTWSLAQGKLRGVISTPFQNSLVGPCWEGLVQVIPV